MYLNTILEKASTVTVIEKERFYFITNIICNCISYIKNCYAVSEKH